jgi:hypothetical protein
MSLSLEGTGSGVTVGSRERAALETALAALRPYEDHPTLGALANKLRGGLGEDEDGGTVEKSLLDIRQARESLQKSEDASPAMLERVEKAERDLEDVYLRKAGSVGYANAARNREAGINF